jgi:hypothetical protein
VRILTPAANGQVDADSWVQVEVDGGTGSYELTLTFQHTSQPDVVVDALGGPGPTWSHQWPALAIPHGIWRIDADVTQDGNCVQTSSIFVTRQ